MVNHCALLVILLAAASCTGSASPIEYPTPCVGSIALTVAVTRSTQPVVTWTPRCGAARLTVESPAASHGSSTVFWSITSAAHTLASGVRYGRVPDNATQDTPPAPLASGQTVLIVVHNDAGHILGQMTVTAP